MRQVLALNEHVASLDAPLDIDPSLSIGESLADDMAETPETAGSKTRRWNISSLEWIGHAQRETAQGDRIPPRG
ncbi:MAG: hypothetical protein M5R42_05370 [Rhodocyclaceae bacterium]|nr:hypothetical protein [Rhodocyclaceae bacterium]